MFQSNPFNNLHGATQKYGFSKDLEMDDDGKIEKQSHLITNNTWEVSRSISSYHPAPAMGSKRDHGNAADIESSNDLFHFDMGIPPFQAYDEEEIKKLVDAAAFDSPEFCNEANRERPYAASLHILKNYRNRFRKLNTHMVKLPSYKDCTIITGQKLSTDAILRLAAENFIQCSSKGDTESSAISHPYACSLAGLSQKDTKDVQLVQYLLASAEKVGSKQFERASKLLLECDHGSSDEGNPIERLVYYFSGALHERIDRETGMVTPKGLGRKQCRDMLKTMGGVTPEKIAMQTHVPFSQVTQLAGIQAILDHVDDSTKIHIVDLEIRTGMHYTILMQALATRFDNPVNYLKITAIGTKSRSKIEETRDWLVSFAQTLNMKLFFNIVTVDEITELNETLFGRSPDEAVAVWIEYYLMFWISRQDILEFLMTFIKALNPRIMIVTEVEGNNNSPVFVTRFIESLFHYGGYFDCLEECLKHDPRNRKCVEYVYFSQAIRNIVATEGEQRTIRHVAVHIWRSFFVRFGLVQAELSTSSMYQANLVLKNFACGKSCTLDMDGKCLLVGWKGTPIHSLSAWKSR